MIILSKLNRKTSIYNIYHPCKGRINTVNKFTVVRQQWLIIIKDKRQTHPHVAANKYVIKASNTKCIEDYDIIVCLEKN